MFESGEFDKLQKKRGGKRKRPVGDVSLDEMYHEGNYPSPPPSTR